MLSLPMMAMPLMRCCCTTFTDGYEYDIYISLDTPPSLSYATRYALLITLERGQIRYATYSATLLIRCRE